MKCELCRDRKAAGSRLCGSCGEMIRRLLSIEDRLRNGEVCEAERLQCQSIGQTNAASNQA
jgi:hypothetical protein